MEIILKKIDFEIKSANPMATTFVSFIDELEQAVNQQLCFKKGWYSFYTCGYICPDCGELLVKTVFHNEPNINTVEGYKLFKRCFTCVACGTLYFPEPGKRLSESGFYIKLKRTQYKEFMNYLNSIGSTVGRMDL